jgi:hypothetical protein
MSPEEKTVIASIFDRLKQAETAPRDAEAERFIADRVGQQPYAPYAMAQTIFVQEQALNQMNARVEELQAQVQRMSAQQSSGGFLSGLFGGPKPAPAPMTPARPFGQQAQPGMAPAAPWQQQPAAGPWGRPAGGSGFLATAMTTAAGVAGGMLLANAITGMMSDHSGGATGQTADAASEPATDAGADNVADADMGGDFGGGDFGEG